MGKLGNRQAEQEAALAYARLKNRSRDPKFGYGRNSPNTDSTRLDTADYRLWFGKHKNKRISELTPAQQRSLAGWIETLHDPSWQLRGLLVNLRQRLAD